MSKSNLHYSLLPCIECALLVLTALSNCYCSVWALEHSVGLTIHNSGTSYKKSHVCAVLAAVKKLRTNRKKQQTEFHEAPPASLSWSRYVSHHRAKAPCSQKQEPDLWLGLSIVWDLAKTKGHYNLMSFFFLSVSSRSGRYGSRALWDPKDGSPSRSMSHSLSRSPSPPSKKRRVDSHPFRPQRRRNSPQRYPQQTHDTGTSHTRREHDVHSSQCVTTLHSSEI